MRIRKEQIAAMHPLAEAAANHARDVLQGLGCEASIEPKTGVLLLREARRGTNRFTFGPSGELTAFRSFDGRVLRFEYDQEARCAVSVDAAGHRTQYHFDARSRLAAVTDPIGVRHEVSYVDDKPVEIRRGDGKSIRLSYHASGVLAALIDGRGAATRFEYDEQGRLVRSIDRCGAVSECEYGERGQLAAIRTPRGGTWRMRCEANPDKRTLVFPDGRAEDYEKVAPSRARVRRGNGQLVGLEFGPTGRINGAVYPDGANVRLEYDSAGCLIAAHDGTHHVAFEFDSEGRPVGEEVDDRRIRAIYDEAGLLTELHTHRGQKIHFEYGEDQRVARIVDWDGRAYAIKRDKRGSVTGVAFPNGTRWKRDFTSAGALCADELVLPRNRIARRYIYDANDLLTEVHDSESGGRRYTFDAEDRLVEVESPEAQTRYAYDPNGNPISIGERDLEYDILDRISGGRGFRCGYDDNGNLVDWVEGEAKTRFQYDGRNRLVSAERAGERPSEYEYDPLGRRLVKRSGGNTTKFTWQGDQLIGEDVEGSQPLHVDYLYLPGTRVPLAMRVNGNTYYYQTDHLETPIRLFDESGKVVWRAEPHGFDMVVSERKVRQPLRFPGHYFDEETGLHYNVCRYYQPRTGRYLSPDALYNTADNSLYLYAHDNPTTFTDPNGLLIPLIIGVVILGGLLAANYKMWSNVAQNKPHDYGEVGEVAAKGMLLTAAGVAAVALGAPVLAVGVGMLLMPAGLATIQAPWGQKWEACQDALPLSGGIRRAERNIDDPSNTNQLTVDLVFDTIGLGTLAAGAAAGPKGGPPRAPFQIKVPTWEPGGFTAGPGGQIFGGQFVWEPVTAVTVTTPTVGAGAIVAAPMAMAATGGGAGGGPVRDKNGKLRNEDGTFAPEPEPPGGRHNRNTEYPHGNKPSVREEVINRNRNERGEIIDPETGDVIPDDQVTIEHERSVVEQWNEEGYNQTQTERNEWYNDPDNLTVKPKSDNSSEGAKMGDRYRQDVGPDYSKE